MQFVLNGFYNNHLPVGATRADVLFSLAASGGAKVTSAKRVFGFLCDNSGSMAGEKIAAAKNGLRVAVDQLSEDDEFFVATFDNNAKMVVGLSRADAAGKRAAHTLIQRIEDAGGTAMSVGLAMARQEFAKRPGAICQLLMLTDGENDGNDQRGLEAELSRCAGVFQAHCRGVGTKWEPKQVRLIADRLLGTLGNIAQPNKLADDFRDAMASAMSKSLSGVRLRLWTPKSVQVGGVKQAFPTEIDMAAKIRPAAQNTIEVDLGAWGEGQQDYLVTFAVTPNAPSQNGTMLCRPSVVYTDPDSGQEVVVEGDKVLAWWSEDASMTSRISPEVAHYTGQAEKASAIQEGIEALQRGDVATATVRLGRAAQLADESGDEGTMRLLRQVVEVEDAAAGTVRVSRSTDRAAVMDLEVASTRTVRAKRA